MRRTLFCLLLSLILLLTSCAPAAVQTEPPTEADLAIGKCPNVLLTPHICGATYEVTDHQSRILNERIKKWMRNEDLEKVVYNRDVLKG